LANPEAGTGGSASGSEAPQRPAGARDALFVYGTLQFGPVLDALLGRIPDADVAVARDRRVAALPGRLYPGLIPEPGRCAGGLVLSGLTPGEWAIIDAFEDPEYDLRPVELFGRSAPVSTYVWTGEVIRNDWLPERFAADHLDRYVEQCTRWRAETR
jgi:gamma-glutamylcyclotransferase (GGCT)/AIG2-like uncharacterized protein YtfP